jgi:L-ascorbate metabolism protein UlaG (beta-lactamase superfamily)
MARAAWAARRYFGFTTVIPCHYRTFPVLEQTAEALRRGLPADVRVIEPEVLVPIAL